MMGNYIPSIRLFTVDESTWEDAEEVRWVLGASVDRALDSDMVMSGSVTTSEEVPPGYVRIVMEIDGFGGFERYELATLYASCSRKTHTADGTAYQCELMSVLRPADAGLLLPGWSFPRGGDPVAGALMLLGGFGRNSIKAPVIPVESEHRMSGDTVAQDNESQLSMARYLLSCAGWRLSIDGHGRVSAVPDITEPVATIDSRDNDVITGDISEESDTYGIPNVVLAMDGDGNWAEARNEDEDSPTSIQAVGFENMVFDKSGAKESQTLLGAAFELLDSSSMAARTLSYTRDFDPGIAEGDVVRIHLPQLGIDGDFKVKTQTIDESCLVRETAEMIIDTFRR